MDGVTSVSRLLDSGLNQTGRLGTVERTLVMNGLREGYREMKLSRVQETAYNKLKEDGGWLSSWRLGVSLATMGVLRKKGLVESRGHNEVGFIFCPQVTLKFKVIA